MKGKRDYSVCWVPNTHGEREYKNKEDLLEAGGREIFSMQGKEEAKEMRRYLEIGAPKDGKYVMISL